jgi:peptidoglycan hydrolase-like protein with peptidoglycan-binding domain
LSVADLSDLMPPAGGSKTIDSRAQHGGSPNRVRRARWFTVGGLVLVVAVLGVAAVIVSRSKAEFKSGPTALATVDMPLGGGSVKRVVATTGTRHRLHHVRLLIRDDRVIYPVGKLAAGEMVTVTATVKRPGWISWLSGKTQTLTRTITVPETQVLTRLVTLAPSGALRVRFSTPVRTVAYGPSANRLHRHTLAHPRTVVTVPHEGRVGTTYVAATVNPPPTGTASAVSWFPAGAKATAVAQPAAGKTIGSYTPITLTFLEPVATALGDHLPTVSPNDAGTWRRVSGHAIRFDPSGYGYGLDQKVSIALPAGVRLEGAGQDRSASTGTWNVPEGSTVRLQQMLAQLGYLPLKVTYPGGEPADTLAAQGAAAEKPPAASTAWEYSETPADLKRQWYGLSNASVLTQGALMKFQDDHDLNVTGYEDTATWHALFEAVIKNQRNTFGYTFVDVSVASQRLNLWHNGKTIIAATPVNTGAPGTPTQAGTWPVFEHLPVTTMSGNNPDGSHYSDPDIRWVSYFHGGDALHEFTRAQYGFPQSLGCVEMPPRSAAQVYPYTPIGTLVHIA